MTRMCVKWKKDFFHLKIIYQEISKRCVVVEYHSVARLLDLS